MWTCSAGTSILVCLPILEVGILRRLVKAVLLSSMSSGSELRGRRRTWTMSAYPDLLVLTLSSTIYGDYHGM